MNAVSLKDDKDMALVKIKSGIRQETLQVYNKENVLGQRATNLKQKKKIVVNCRRILFPSIKKDMLNMTKGYER